MSWVWPMRGLPLGLHSQATSSHSFIFWELTALTSVFLIWAADTEDALHCGVRYLVIQVASGVILLAGTNALQPDWFIGLRQLYEQGLTNATTIILWAIAIKAAFLFSTIGSKTCLSKSHFLWYGLPECVHH